MSTKAKTLLKGSLLRTFYFFASALVGLFIMPFMIRSLGDELYGMWMFAASLVGFYLLFDMGLSSATQRYVSQAIGRESHKDANTFINTSFFLFTIIGALVLVISFALAWILPLFLKNITQIHLFRNVMIILGANLAISMPMRTFSGILMSHLRFDIQTGIELCKLLLRAALVILVLKLGYKVIAVALVFCSSDLLGYMLFYVFAKKVAPYIHIHKKYIDKTRIKTLYSYSWKTLLGQVADKLRLDIDNFVIVGFLGLNFVTIYAIAASLARHFIDLISSVLGILTPVFSQYEAKGDYNSIREKFIFMTKISGYFSMLIGGILIIFGKAFIQRWVGSAYLPAYTILIILTISFVFGLMQAPSVQLLYGISKHMILVVSNSIDGVINLILSLILVKYYGLVGVALGTAIPMIINKVFIQPIYTCLVIKFDIKKYYLEVLLPTVCNSCIILIALWFVIKNIISASYISMTLLALGVIILFSASIFFLGFSLLERNYFRKMIFNTE